MRADRLILMAFTICAIGAKTTTAGEAAGTDRLFTNKTGQHELAEYVGKPVWELLAACSGFARAAAGYYGAHNAPDERKHWSALSLESYGTAQFLLANARAVEDDAARALLNPPADERHQLTADALAKLDPASGKAEVFQQETLILRGPYSRMCFAASLESE